MTPRLWVWIGAPDDKLDVIRYVRATDKDIVRQPVVAREIESMRAKIAELEAFRDRVIALMDESVGVAGLHLNGDVAAWESLLAGGLYVSLSQTAGGPMVLSLTRMAKQLGVSSRWLLEQARAGLVPSLRAEKKHLFNPEAVEAALAELARASGPATADPAPPADDRGEP